MTPGPPVWSQPLEQLVVLKTCLKAVTRAFCAFYYFSSNCWGLGQFAERNRKVLERKDINDRNMGSGSLSTSASCLNSASTEKKKKKVNISNVYLAKTILGLWMYKGGNII